MTGTAPAPPPPGTVPALPVRALPARGRLLRERIRSSVWVVPAVMVVGAFVAQSVLVEIDEALATDPASEALFATSAAEAQAIASTVAAAMLTFLGVVFSLSILALQLTSGQFSPRVMRTFVRARSTKLALGTFMATFVFALMTLVSVESDGPGRQEFAPVLSLLVLVVLVLGSLAVFLAFVRTIVRLIRVSYVIDAVGVETAAALRGRSPATTWLAVPPAQLVAEPAVVRYGGRAGILGGVDIHRLVRLASAHGAVIEIRVRFGDYVAAGAPALAVHGGRPIDPGALARCLLVHTERSMFLDAAFGLRQLVDIAARALSPAVNDPTTAVQVLDQVGHLLFLLGSSEDLPSVVAGEDGQARVLITHRSWTEHVDLALVEIRRYGHDSPQITRRLVSLFDDLAATLPVERHPALARQRELLELDVARSDLDPSERGFYLTADRGGLG